METQTRLHQPEHSGALGARLAIGTLLIVWAYVLGQLITHESGEPVIGRYSLPLFLTIVVWTIVIIPLLYWMLRPEPFVRGINRILTFIQSRSWLALLTIIVLLFVVYLALNSLRLVDGYPGLQPVFVFGAYALIAVIILYGWRRTHPVPLWRKLAVAVALIAIALELVLQGLAVAGALPSGFSSTAGLFKPYGRLILAADDGGLQTVNRYGWHAPAFDLSDDNHKVLLLGDELLYAAETEPDEQLSAQLEALLTANGDNAEVIALGAPGFGPAHYYEGIKNTVEIYRPNDIIIFINARDDFANNMVEVDPRTPRDTVFYTIGDDGFWNIHEGSLFAEHLLWHRFTDAHGPVSHTFLRSLRSHLLTLKVIGYMLSGDDAAELPEGTGPLASLGIGAFVFAAEPEPNSLPDKSIRLTENLIEIAAQVAKANGATLHVVVVPTFSDEFLSTTNGDAWQLTVSNDYDLLAPERSLAAFATDKQIDILTAGLEMQAAGIWAEQIQSWYRPNGMGFTPEGEQQFAQMVYDAFFAPSQ